MYELLKSEYEKTQKVLKDVESSIRRITGRNATQFSSRGNLRFKNDQGFAPKLNAFGRKRPMPYQNRPDQTNDELDEESDDDNLSTKKPSLQSTVVSTMKDVKSRRDTLEEQKSDKRIFARNRRMFGMIVGTLQKFQNEETGRKVQIEKRAEIDKKVEEAALKERELMQKEKEKLFITRREKQIQVRCLEKKLEIAQDHKIWQTYHKPLVNFIKTTAEPHIMYLPSKHNTQSQKALAASQEQVSALIEVQNTKVDQELMDLESCYTKQEEEELIAGIGDKENCEMFPEAESSEDGGPAMRSTVKVEDDVEDNITPNPRTTEDPINFAPDEDQTQSTGDTNDSTTESMDNIADREEFEPIYD